MAKITLYLQYFTATFIFLVFLSGVFPLLFIPFTGVLPYLHQWELFERLIFFASLWIFAIALYLLLSTKKQKSSVISTLQFNFKDWIGVFLGSCVFIFTGAELLANTMGPLVKILPNKPYASQMVVVNAEKRGSKYKSTNLDLKSNTDGSIYYLSLSEPLFSRNEFDVGDKLTLTGKQNFFGVYIEKLQLKSRGSA